MKKVSKCTNNVLRKSDVKGGGMDLGRFTSAFTYIHKGFMVGVKVQLF